jgi:DNA-binding protein HU-beta
MAKDARIPETVASAVMESLQESIIQTLKQKGGKVKLTGFGTFYKTHRKARNGRNPKTGEAIRIKAGDVVKFKAGKKLKTAV